MLDDAGVAEYLGRIGAEKPRKADLEGLRHLQERHVLTVPFENIDYHLGREIHLGERAVEKIVRQRRGGGCYEVNSAFAELLRALGYRVEILPGRVHRPDGLGPAMCHLALRVTLDGEPWLVDAGFGRNSRHPLRLTSSDVQKDPHGEYLVLPVEGGGADVLLDGRPLYRLDGRPCRLGDFTPTLWWWRSCPDSPFLQELFCSMPLADGRVTLKNRRLVRVDGGQRTIEPLDTDAAVLAAYRTHFGIDLDELPEGDGVKRTVGIQLT
ncbi:Arylamine N-acetyltransferase [Streptomyces sp. enrichment culture]|uniref:arylamine N-acetyltransferase family protein n=1 Tax=Streptomyces sp. enrichment culture TaxID=1795815 RepID=UPI003F5555DC